MQTAKALLLSNMLSSTENIENADIATFVSSCVSTPDISVLNITCTADFLDLFMKTKLIGDC